ncbi:MAG: hypothetical protein CVU09_13290 [Bacteroidetes bacterium HGW-Bacteroidetes-4]|jgi:hypothetical protein|nr:MAG: hypothetical protein CVU09_13290 [Bacteroidetes bacterium HGW-Bacteroidetes-4]
MQTSKQYFRSLSLIHYALLAGQLVFAGVALYLTYGKTQLVDSPKGVFIYVVPLIALLAVLVSQAIYRLKIKKLISYQSLIPKMTEYQSIFIIRLALIEGASLFAIVVYLLTIEAIFMAIAVLLIVYFVLLRPTREKIALDLELNPSDKMKLEQADALIADIQEKK